MYGVCLQEQLYPHCVCGEYTVFMALIEFKQTLQTHSYLQDNYFN